MTATTGPSETSPQHTYIESPTAAEVVWAITNPPEGRTVHVERFYGGKWIDVNGTPLADINYLKDQDQRFRFNWLRIRNTKAE